MAHYPTLFLVVLLCAFALPVVADQEDGGTDIVLGAVSTPEGIELHWVVLGDAEQFVLNWTIDGVPQPGTLLPPEARTWSLKSDWGIVHVFTLTAVGDDGDTMTSNTAVATRYPWCGVVAPLSPQPVRAACLFPIPLG